MRALITRLWLGLRILVEAQAIEVSPRWLYQQETKVRKGNEWAAHRREW